MADDQAQPPAEQQNWMMFIDPAWDPARDGTPPPEAVLGGWLLDQDGAPGLFHPNAEYRPLHPDSPTDPIDASLRQVLAGQQSADLLLTALRGSYLEIALGEDDRPIVTPAPDLVHCVLVVTAAVHKDKVIPDRWRQVGLAELVALLPEGVDVLINPGAPASMRLLASVLREAVAAP
ncbi:type VII secretion system-associated protein [Solihabitans fulvus]|uniref:type VII secretion system-associated protein n=1 Tax=Solihabitans fulvus TaxID=1892852 RepID=UPI001661E38E|nr:type VII secretion system-associated protein [Solihabitans fulvus]